jgi:hypothetical protein
MNGGRTWLETKLSTIAVRSPGADILNAAQEGRQTGAGQTIENLQTALSAINPARLAHLRKMTGHGRNVAADKLLELGDAALTLTQQLSDAQSRRMGQGLDDADAPVANGRTHERRDRAPEAHAQRQFGFLTK